MYENFVGLRLLATLSTPSISTATVLEPRPGGVAASGTQTGVRRAGAGVGTDLLLGGSSGGPVPDHDGGFAGGLKGRRLRRLSRPPVGGVARRG